MIGLRAARANFLPALVVQAGMVALLIAYYQHPPTTALLNQLADLKQRTGYLFTSTSSIIAAAIIPEILRILFFQKGRIRRCNLSNLLFTIPFWGSITLTVDLFYQFQAFVFGSQVDFTTVVIKVLVDQLGYTALFATPVTCLLYDWKQHGYNLKRLRKIVDRSYYRRVVFPTLITNWAVWIPLISVVYCLPLTLQIPLFSLALSLWVLLYTWISETRNEITSDPPANSSNQKQQVNSADCAKAN